MNISVIIPVYNGAQTITPLTERLAITLPKIAEQYEVIFVCDGSPDNSWQVIQKLAQIHPFVQGILLMRNFGQHNALLCGVRAAQHEIIITMDDDLQHPPEEIPTLLKKLDDGFDLVFGIPKKLPHNWWRNLTSVITKTAISSVMGMKSVRDISSYRIFRTYLRQAFENFNGPDLLLDVLLSWGTTRIGFTTINESPREIGESNYTFHKLVSMALTMLTSYTTLPLRFASFSGFIFTIFGALLFIYVVIIYFAVGSLPGFPFLASAISIFSGVQLFALGIIGEYLSHMFERTTGRPTYQILTTTHTK